MHTRLSFLLLRFAVVASFAGTLVPSAHAQSMDWPNEYQGDSSPDLQNQMTAEQLFASYSTFLSSTPTDGWSGVVQTTEVLAHMAATDPNRLIGVSRNGLSESFFQQLSAYVPTTSYAQAYFSTRGALDSTGGSATGGDVAVSNVSGAPAPPVWLLGALAAGIARNRRRSGKSPA